MAVKEFLPQVCVTLETVLNYHLSGDGLFPLRPAPRLVLRVEPVSCKWHADSEIIIRIVASLELCWRLTLKFLDNEL